MTEKIKAYSYLRISTDAQMIGDGVRRQMEASKKYAEENGYQLVETISDIGVSGFSGKNVDSGAFGNFLAVLYQRPDQLTVIQFLLVIEVIRSGSFAKKFQASWHLLRMSP